MTTATDLFVEFRCNSCYQVRHEPAAQAGSESECPYCHNANIVPEATEDRLRSPDRVEQTAATAGVQAGMYVDAPMSAEEIERSARERAAKKVAEPGGDGFADVGHMSCGHSPRIVAHLIDAVLAAVVYVISIFTGHIMSQMGLCQSLEQLAVASATPEIRDWVCYGGVAMMAHCVYWYCNAAFGYGPGKFLMGIKITNATGQPPGFVQGVLLRSWIANFLLNVVPLVGLANVIVFFCGHPPRALHDYIAGTWVIHRS